MATPRRKKRRKEMMGMKYLIYQVEGKKTNVLCIKINKCMCI
jgi:hypothetical protein